MIENFQSFLKLRSRSNWEACDSGILIWRNTISYIILFMGTPLLFCVILLAFLNSYLHFWGILILWCLKPLFDRFILQVISVRFFRNDASYKTISRGLIKNIFKGLIGDITWRRFSIYRASRLPVRILEGNKGKMIKRRIQNLKNGGLDFCALLTCLCVVLEIILLVGFLLILFNFSTEYTAFTVEYFSDYTSQISLAILFLSSLIMLFIEPLYMCMGFGIYINSRSIVEGWDIEWGFNSFVKEEKNESAKIRKSHLVNIIPIIVFVLLFSNVLQPLQAEEWYQNNSEDVPVEILDEVLSSEDFASVHVRKWIRLKEINFGEPSSGFQFDELNIREIAGFFLRALLIVIIAAALVFAGIRLLKAERRLPENGIASWRKKNVPGFADKKNPDSLIDSAKNLFAAGQIRYAWAACLSAVLGLYADQGNIVFALDDTESDCLTRINNSILWGKEESAQLILRWVKFAYAGIEPDQKYFYETISFYDNLKNKLLIIGDTHE